jgi:hypothetical protein
VLWTRGSFADDDLRPTIRRWFADEGLAEVSFDGERERYRVGVARWPATSPGGRLEPTARRLFRSVR